MKAAQVWSRAASLVPAVGWWTGAAMLLVAALASATLLQFEFGAARLQPIAIDEWYFLSCAARGLAVGQVPIAGCHDTKSPLIFLVHQWVQPSAWAYDIVRVKVAAFGESALLTAAAATLAHRMGGRLAAVVTAALMLVVFLSDRHLYALKTELLGSVFMLAALWPLVVARGLPGPAAWALSGLLFGFALMSKQSFVFAMVGSMAWWCWATVRGRVTPGRGAFALLLFGVASLLPIAALAAVFQSQGKLVDFLLSTFVYPTVYSAQVPGSALNQLAWKAGAVADYMQAVPLVVMLFLGSMAWLAQGSRHGKPHWLNEASPVVAAALGMLLMLLVAPILFAYHALPAWALMAAVGGAAASRLLQAPPVRIRRVVAAVLLVAVAIQSLQGWITTGGKAGVGDAGAVVPRLVIEPGDYGYVVGTWPAFFVVTRLVPASDVMYPNALPGAPASWAYTPPDSATSKGRRLIALQEQNAIALRDDFKRTPPRYVMVVDALARAPGSSRVTDIEVLETYLHERCRLDREVPGGVFERGRLYVCER